MSLCFPFTDRFLIGHRKTLKRQSKVFLRSRLLRSYELGTPTYPRAIGFHGQTAIFSCFFLRATILATGSNQ